MDFLLGVSHVPGAESSQLAVAKMGRNEELLRELNLLQACSHDFDAIAAAQVQGRLAVDQLLAGWVRQIRVFLSVTRLLENPPPPGFHHPTDLLLGSRRRRMNHHAPVALDGDGQLTALG